MKSVHPYLNFPGTAEQAFLFYKSVFGGEFFGIVRFGHFAGCGEMQLREEDKDKIAHISLPLGNTGTVLMASDHIDSSGRPFVMGNGFLINLEPETASEADTLMQKLSEGGSMIMPLQKTEWAEKYGMCVDKFGVQWMINFMGDCQFEFKE